MNQINMNPEFTTDDSVVAPEGATEVAEQEETPVEKETQSDSPSDQEPEKEEPAEPAQKSDNTDSLVGEVQGLKAEREKLLDEIKTLRGEKREIKQEKIDQITEQIDALKDVNPDDVNLIEKVLRAKGYVSKAEVEKMTYEAVKNDELNKFLDKYPEYKPVNDPNDVNWNALQREFSLYRAPTDARQIGQLLERAHRSISKTTSDQSVQARQQVRTASVGGGGQRSPSRRSSVNPRLAELAESAMQGWSPEELAKIKENL